ncbi:MAG TPA: T9SS type A sorting domain-containing protein, partial [Bacteroidia bacterium]|nr:T9SS type A sorting domain-containing protein [Bacteroidia bacterium]
YLNCFPNPAQHFLTIQAAPEAGIYTLEFLNTEGQVLSTREITCTGQEQVLETDVHNLGSGMYLLRLYNARSSFSTRFVVWH